MQAAATDYHQHHLAGHQIGDGPETMNNPAYMQEEVQEQDEEEDEELINDQYGNNINDKNAPQVYYGNNNTAGNSNRQQESNRQQLVSPYRGALY